MTVRSAVLGRSITITNAGVTIYTVPAGYRAIVKSLYLQNTAVGANRTAVQILSGGAVVASFFRTLGASPSATESELLNLWMVMNAGDSLKILPASNSVYANASGAELLL